MKTFTSTFALVLSAALSMAFPQGSELTVELVGHRPQSIIVLNGRTYTSASNALYVNGLAPGNYPIQIVRPSHWGGQGVTFSGTIRVPQRSSVLAIITPTGMKVDAQPLAYNGPSYWDGQNGHHQNPNGNGGFVSMRPNGRPIEPVVCTPIVLGMHPEVFSRAMETVRSQWFDSDCVRLAKQIIRTNGASSQQIADLMRLMDFESSRLEVAKFGYQYVADPENYFIVNDVFWFSSSIRELDRFISGC